MRVGCILMGDGYLIGQMCMCFNGGCLFGKVWQWC